MAKLTDEEVREIEEGIPNLRGPILLTWIRRLLEDRRERIAAAGRTRPSPRAVGYSSPASSAEATMQEPPSDFDWVSARAECGGERALNRLRSIAQQNVDTRNSHAGGRFALQSDGPTSFTVKSEKTTPQAWVTFFLRDASSLVITTGPKNTTVARDQETVSMALDEIGRCRFHARDKALDAWQLLQMFLEPILFAPTDR